ncbi:MAG: tRNA threonylcarbamoyladenosine biosynthesis protein TsaE [Candidatus Paceibacteria bacterium]|jgi:tRNA threonylcarbamoyladenosine biosynthesis protein TsaE
MEYTINGIEELHSWSKSFLDSLEQNEQAGILTLSGDLGSGKTTLVQHLAEHLGITETITSPTFVIQKEYKVNEHAWVKKLIHVDAYRLESKSELEYLGWNELINNPNVFVVMEWPEMVTGINLPNAISISMTINKDHSRAIVQK